MMRYVFLLCLTFALVYASCDNGCNSHGTCIQDACQCISGWGGVDCSIWDQEIDVGVTVASSVNTMEWKYFHTSLGTGANGISVTVLQTSSFGDLDLYVGQNPYPNQHDYLYRDSEAGITSSVSIEDPQNGVWYFGVYGYWGSDFEITVDIEYGCVTDCGEFGYCDVDTCICYVPYEGDDCSIYNEPIESGNTYYNYVDTLEWKYYYVDAQDGESMMIALNQDDSSYDVDLYVAGDRFPYGWNYDYINGTTDAYTSLTITNLQNFRYEIGIYGYIGGSYSLTVTVFESGICPNECSHNGECEASCDCYEGFSGSSCGTYDENLEIDNVYSGFVESGEWNYWHIQYFTDSPLRISVTQTSDGDCDVYVRETVLPTRANYQFSDLSLADSFEITIEQPGNEVWNIGVYGWVTCSYDFSVSVVEECQCVDESHGTCLEGTTTCFCDIDYAGQFCTIPTLQIESGQVIANQFEEPHVWDFYYFESDSRLITISMVEQNTQGQLFLVVSLSGYPSGENFDFYDVNTESDFHEVEITWANTSQHVYFIGVITSSVSAASSPIEYSITAFGAPF